MSSTATTTPADWLLASLLAAAAIIALALLVTMFREARARADRTIARIQREAAEEQRRADGRQAGVAAGWHDDV